MNAFAHLRYAARSDVGRRRLNNEDAFGVFPENGIFCISDGMGGGDDGEVASVATVGAVEGFCKVHPPPQRASYPIDEEVTDLCVRLNEVSAWINGRSRDKCLKTSGATFVGICFDAANPSVAVVLHAGDSRLYRMRGQSLRQITKDHSAAELIGAKSEKDINPKFRGMILRAVGVQSSVEIERTPLAVKEGDKILICSDGLSKMVDASMMASLLYGASDPGTAVNALINAANDAGGGDNVTVVVVEVGVLPQALPIVQLYGGLESETEESDSPTASSETRDTGGQPSQYSGSTDSESVEVFAPAQDTADEDQAVKAASKSEVMFSAAAIVRRRLLRVMVVAVSLIGLVLIGCGCWVFVLRCNAEKKMMMAKRHDEVARAAEEAGRRAAVFKAKDRRLGEETVRESERRHRANVERERMSEERLHVIRAAEEKAESARLERARQERMRRDAERDAARMRKVEEAEQERRCIVAAESIRCVTENAGADMATECGAEAVRRVSGIKIAGDFVSAAIGQIGGVPPKSLYANLSALREEDGGDAAKFSLAAAITRDVQEIARRLADSVMHELPKIEADLVSQETGFARRTELRERRKRYKDFLVAESIFSEGKPDDAETQRLCAEIIRKVPEWFRR